MNREIKFRAWAKDTEEMFDFQNILEHGFDEIINNKDFELMQFTGLHDKNGKEIYEGDILKDKNGIIYEVLWNVSGFNIFCNKENLIKSLNSDYDDEQEEEAELIGAWNYNKEVIGNKFENPELLGEKNDL